MSRLRRCFCQQCEKEFFVNSYGDKNFCSVCLKKIDDKEKEKFSKKQQESFSLEERVLELEWLVKKLNDQVESLQHRASYNGDG